MIEPETQQKMELIVSSAIRNGKCVTLESSTAEGKFVDGDTEVRFKHENDKLISIAIENEPFSVYAYWSNGYEPTFIGQDGETNLQSLYLATDIGIMF